MEMSETDRRALLFAAIYRVPLDVAREVMKRAGDSDMTSPARTPSLRVVEGATRRGGQMPETYRAPWRRMKIFRADGSEESNYRKCLSAALAQYFAASGRPTIGTDGQAIRLVEGARDADFWGRPGPGGDSFLAEAQRAGLIQGEDHDVGSPAPSIQHPPRNSAAIDTLKERRAELRAAGSKKRDPDLDLEIFGKDPGLYARCVDETRARAEQS
jgi:hypothetical protein